MRLSVAALHPFGNALVRASGDFLEKEEEAKEEEEKEKWG